MAYRPVNVTSRIHLGRLFTAFLLAIALLLILRWLVSPTAASEPIRSGPTVSVPMKTNSLLATNNESNLLDSIPVWFSEQSDFSVAAAWGDVDSDGDLDLAIADLNGAHKVYLNEDGVLQGEPDWSALDGSGSRATDLAWGDADNDGDLDLAFSYVGHNRVYYNVNGRLQNFAAWYSGFTPNKVSTSLAWGDINGDGYLDLVIGNYDLNDGDANFTGRNEIYFNNGAGQFSAAANWLAAENIDTNGIAVADFNNDGYLDIISANSGFVDNTNTLGEVNHVYLSVNGTIPTTAAFAFGGADNSTDVALGDVNGDGLLDIAVSNMPVIQANVAITPQNKLYLNNGISVTATAAWSTTLGDHSQDVTFGDVDGDGDLDLAVGVIPASTSGVDISGGQNRIYLNEGGQLATTPAWSDPAAETTYGVAWGDVNGDGQLDLAIANLAGQDKVYLNQYLPISSAPSWASAELDASMDVAWGDYDGDGDLDLAVANNRIPLNLITYIEGSNRVYYNQNGQLQLGWSSSEQEDSYGVAWGDVNNDGSLELAVANGALELIGFGGNPASPNRLYAAPAPGQPLDTTAVWSSTENDDTFQVAWGDVDGDGDLDLAAANSTTALDIFNTGLFNNIGAPNRVYINRADGLETTASWVSDDNDRTLDVAWGDVDGDGDLDLAVANARTINGLDTSGGQNKLYLNENGTLQNPAVWASKEFEDTRSIAWGDVDGDGDLDLAAGNGLNPNRVYLNVDGQLQRKAYWFSLDQDDTYDVIWADIDGDGDLDLFAANNNGPDKIYINTDGQLQRTAVWLAESSTATGAAVGDADGDGDLDIATSQLNPSTGAGLPNLLYRKEQPAHPLTVGEAEAVAIGLQLVEQPSSLAPAADYAAPTIRDGLLPISYTLYHPLGQPYGYVRGFYSLDGGDNWLPAVPTTATQRFNLSSTPYPTPTATANHLFIWDTVASGVFGQSDNVVFRLEAYPKTAPAALGTYSYANDIAGPYQRPFIATQTYPFRLRGQQVRVLSATVPISNALVYRLPDGQSVGGQPLQDGQATPFRTDAFGYLQGRATLAVSDTLMALVPVTTTSVTGGAMSFDGVDDYIIRNPVLSDFPQNEITVAFWMQGDGIGTNRGTPFSYATDSFDDEFLIFDYNNFSIHREFAFLPTGISANDGEWHHIAVTWRGADGQAILYKDGTAVFTGTLAAGTSLDPSGSFMIGQEQDSIEGGFQPFQSFKGLMDDIEVWNQVLEASEIQDGMENGRVGDEPGLVLYWTFDEDNGQRTLDQSGSESHGRIESATRIGIPGGYTVYYTNGEPEETAVAAHAVSASSIQTLTVTAANPLILFDVDVSLEWDASQDPAYLDQLEFDLQKASAYLYDFTDGQVALGEVTVSQNGDNWLFSDVVVRSTNRLRPFA
ncbi:MAG: VCBS repeat-containing protein, partial [Anaerolineales bacterium]|nr:VCBS repeat-containing protein [Anaerolineales bacterium]